MYHAEKVEPPVRIHRSPVAVTHLWKRSESEAHFVYSVLRDMPYDHTICDKAGFAVAKYCCKAPHYASVFIFCGLGKQFRCGYTQTIGKLFEGFWRYCQVLL